MQQHKQQRLGYKDRRPNIGGKASTQTTMAAKHPPVANFNQCDNGGKASASKDNPMTKYDPDDADEMKRRQVQKQKLSEERR
jgi:hypothetical protein